MVEGFRVVVLDHPSFHISGVIRAARKGLADQGIYLYYLPPCSPELNRTEPVFRQVEHLEIPPPEPHDADRTERGG
ncbi:transposase [Isosphaeraceae bacterium EP7]